MSAPVGRPAAGAGAGKKRLVLLGGGHAHLHVLKAIAAAIDSEVSVTLVTPVGLQLYSGMLPGFLAGHYELGECSIDLRVLAEHARARLLPSAARRVNPAKREVHCADGEVLPYDVLSIDVGSESFTGAAQGTAKHAVAVRPLERFVEGWDSVLKRVRAGAVKAVSIVGGGAAGVELAFAMHHRFRNEAGQGAPHVRILTDARGLLPEFGGSVRRRLARLALERNIGTHTESPVAEVGSGYIRLKNNIEFATDATFWAGGAAAPAFIRESGLRTDEHGFLAVNAFLQSISHGEVFGAGDCATDVGNPRPKAGVYAVRAAPTLMANLQAALHGGPWKHHVTSRRFLALVSCGSRHAVLAWGPLSFEGAWAWRWKDRIDRRFVASYSPQALAAPR